MNADVINRDILIAACLKLLDQVAAEHPAGHQRVMSRITSFARAGS